MAHHVQARQPCCWWVLPHIPGSQQPHDGLTRKRCPLSQRHPGSPASVAASGPVVCYSCDVAAWSESATCCDCALTFGSRRETRGCARQRCRPRGVIGGIYGIGGGSPLSPILVGRGLPLATVAPATLVSTFIAGAITYVVLAATAAGQHIAH